MKWQNTVVRDAVISARKRILFAFRLRGHKDQNSVRIVGIK
jgi:hypothetical protein